MRRVVIGYVGWLFGSYSSEWRVDDIHKVANQNSTDVQMLTPPNSATAKCLSQPCTKSAYLYNTRSAPFFARASIRVYAKSHDSKR